MEIKLIDFLELVNFRAGVSNLETDIIRIYYPDKDDLSFGNLYRDDRYFEYGVYDFSADTRKRIIQTINPFILNCYVDQVEVNEESGMLEIFVTILSDIKDKELDKSYYDLEKCKLAEK